MPISASDGYSIIHDFIFRCYAKKWGGYSPPAPHVPPGLINETRCKSMAFWPIFFVIGGLFELGHLAAMLVTIVRAPTWRRHTIHCKHDTHSIAYISVGKLASFLKLC